MGESDELPFLVPASPETTPRRTREHDVSRREGQIIVVGFLVANLISIIVLLAMRGMVDAGAEPTQQFVLGIGGLVAVAAVSQIVRWRVRRRSGLPMRSRSPRDDVRFLRDSADACGWPRLAVELVLLVSWLAVMVLAISFFLTAFTGTWD
ncbi:MAG TPA: hypothetical protein VFL59_07075 [Candidatus Nanopelagicales bacterium]|nr:hypothetical protein [Candidatus Nanopelagicales bacterium]